MQSSELSLHSCDRMKAGERVRGCKCVGVHVRAWIYVRVHVRAWVLMCEVS